MNPTPFAISRLLLPLALLLGASSSLLADSFRVGKEGFLLSGEPFQIRSGEIHYPRVAREDWAGRIRMAKAMGLNTISTYVFWNLHETRKGEFDFEGDKDVAGFIRTCAEEGMRVIVRPGPYVCAEWDLGGLPGWLLKEPGIRLRSSDPLYLGPAKEWMKRMGEMLGPLSVAQGGPVLMVQLENEFGNFGKDPAYLEEMEKALRAGGYGGLVFTGDGRSPALLEHGGRPGTLRAVNFGRDAEGAFRILKDASPGQPAFTSEFWVGWFDQWGRPRHDVDQRSKIEDLRHIMKVGASFNIYMFHGGTTRGLWTGANWHDRYVPTTCCYDYRAPLDEAGRPTSLYHTFRAIIRETPGVSGVPEVPELAAPGSIGVIRLDDRLSLFDALAEGRVHETLQSMEDLDQTTGMVLYRTTVTGPLEGALELAAVKDRVHVFLNGEAAGLSGRSTSGKAIPVRLPAGQHRLDLLVENMGRVNFGKTMDGERKGLTGTLSLGGQELGPFEHFSLPMQTPPDGKFTAAGGDFKPAVATYHRGRVRVEKPCATWLDMRGFGRGMLWFNGRNLGRYWHEGPVQTVFVPAAWMNAGEDNEIVVLELEMADPPDQIPTAPRQFWGRGQ